MPDVIRGVASSIEEQTEGNFLARFGKPIKIHVDRSMRDGVQQVEFSFTLTKPGLLPTAIEREWFRAFVDGYRCACQVMIWRAAGTDTTATDTPDAA